MKMRLVTALTLSLCFLTSCGPTAVPAASEAIVVAPRLISLLTQFAGLSLPLKNFRSVASKVTVTNEKMAIEVEKKLVNNITINASVPLMRFDLISLLNPTDESGKPVNPSAFDNSGAFVVFENGSSRSFILTDADEHICLFNKSHASFADIDLKNKIVTIQVFEGENFVEIGTTVADCQRLKKQYLDLASIQQESAESPLIDQGNNAEDPIKENEIVPVIPDVLTKDTQDADVKCHPQQLDGFLNNVQQQAPCTN